MDSILSNVKNGIEDAIPIVLGYLAIGTAYGVIAKQADLSIFQGTLMSVVVFAGASQFIGVGLLAAGAGAAQILLTTLFINARHILMSASLAPYLQKVKSPLLAVLSFGVTDETFAVTVTRFKEGKATQWYMLSINFTAYLSWVLGSFLGILIGSFIPLFLKSSFAFALPSMFIGLLVLQIESRFHIVVLVTAAIASSIFYFQIYGIGNVLLATLAAAAIGATLERWTEKSHQ